MASTEWRVIFIQSLTECLKSLHCIENHASLLDRNIVSKEECLLGYISMLRIVKKSHMHCVCCRNENFSGSIWPRLWPAGSQGMVRIYSIAQTEPDEVAALESFG